MDGVTTIKQEALLRSIGFIAANGEVQYKQDETRNELLENVFDLPDSGNNAAVKEIQINFDAYLQGRDRNNDGIIDPAQLKANIFFLTGTIIDDWSNEIRLPDQSMVSSPDLFDRGIGSRTYFRGSFTIDIRDRNDDGRLTFGEMNSGKFLDNFKTELNARAQANFNMDLSIQGQRSLPRLLADFHLTYSLKAIDVSALAADSAEAKYRRLFGPSPTIWISDLALDMGSFFSDFLNPIVKEIKPFTKEIQKITDILDKQIPGTGIFNGGRNLTILGLAEVFGRGGNKQIQFLKQFKSLIDIINAIPTDAGNLVIPIGAVFTLSGNVNSSSNKTGASLSGNVSSISNALNAPVTPKALSAGGTATPGAPSANAKSGVLGFLQKLNDPNSALRVPFLADFSKILDVITGKTVDLVTYTPKPLRYDTQIELSTILYTAPVLKAGIRGKLGVELNLGFGFDTFGINKYFQTRNVKHIFDGFYISDNFVNGRDMPDIVFLAGLEVFAGLDAGVASVSLAAGIDFKGTLDWNDNNGKGANDNKFRVSEIADVLLCNPLDIFEVGLLIEFQANLKVKVPLIGTVFSKQLFREKIFEFKHKPAPCFPILTADEDGDGTFSLHMGNGLTDPILLADIGASQYADDFAAAKAENRIHKNKEDVDEIYVIKQIGTDEIEITATIDGTDYTRTFSGVKRIVGVTGNGKNKIDVSGLTSIEAILIGTGSGDNELIGGSGNDTLVSNSSGKTTIRGNGGSDLLVARGGTSTLTGNAGSDTYRFLGNYGTVTVDDLVATDPNVLDFSKQTASVVFDTLNMKAMQGGNTATWNRGTSVGWIAGGAGADTIDMSFESKPLHIAIKDEGSDALKAKLSAAAQGLVRDTDDAALNDGIVSNATTGAVGGTQFGDGSFIFTGIESVIGGINSDIFAFDHAHALTGSVYGAATRTGGANVGLNSAAERPTSRNTLDLSSYNTGVTIDESSASANSRFTTGAQSVKVGGFHNIFGGAAGDTLVGNAANNIILGGGGDDTVRGMGGNDLLSVDGLQFVNASGAMVEIAKSGNRLAWQQLPNREWTWFGQVIENVQKSTGAQTAEGGDGDDVLFGSAGADTLRSDAGNDTMIGDFAQIRFAVDGMVDTITSKQTGVGSGDTIVGLTGRHIVVGGQGADNITLGDGENLVLGDAGVIKLKASTRRAIEVSNLDELLSSGTKGGSDIITVGAGSNLILGGFGSDVVNASDAVTSTNVVLGDHGRVLYSKSDNGQHLLSLIQTTKPGVNESSTDSHDVINLASGNAIVVAGAGNDQVTVSATLSTQSTYRFVVGGQGRVEFDAFGRMTRLVSTDTSTTQDGNDTVTIGAARTAESGSFGSNIVVTGMGNDTILIGGGNLINGLNSGRGLSTDIVIGDNGEVIRTAKTTPSELELNELLVVRSILNDLGGNDIIASGSGDKTLIGGMGNDQITAFNGFHFVMGDSGSLNYDSAAENGVLRSLVSEGLVFGGDDLITLGDGFKMVVGGFGSDSVRVNATGVAKSSTSDQRGRFARYLLGDAATVVFDVVGGVQTVTSTDVIAATAGDDTITVGAIDTTADLGHNVIVGGLGADRITVQPGAYSIDTVVGDNALIEHKAQSYGIQTVTTLNDEKGDADAINLGRGVKTVVGGFGADTINLATAISMDGALNRSIVLGDSGTLTFEAGNPEGVIEPGNPQAMPGPATPDKLRTATSKSLNFGGADNVNILDGDVIFVGGTDRDRLNVDSSREAFRLAVGDNASLQFTAAGLASDVTLITTLDTTASTGDADTITIGNGNLLSGVSTLGNVIAIGGMGADSINVNAPRSSSVLVGDNASLVRNALLGQVTRLESITLEQGAGDTLTVQDGDHILVGGLGSDSISAGKGKLVAAGDSIQFSALANSANSTLFGTVTLAASVGLPNGSADTIAAGAGLSTEDGIKLIIGGAGADSISVLAQGGFERVVVGDNAEINLDSSGRVVGVQSLDSGITSTGSDTITLAIGNAASNREVNLDFNVLVGGLGSDSLIVNSSNDTQDVVAGDNLELRRARNAMGEYHLALVNALNGVLGGDDTIALGSGNKVVVGGAGADSIDVRTGTGSAQQSVVLGDAGAVFFDQAITGFLSRILSTSEALGGNDSIQIAGGNAYVVGGRGNDRINTSATGAERVFLGDNGQIDFVSRDGRQDLARVQTTSDQLNQTEQTDRDTFNLQFNGGRNYVLGGEGRDVALVLPGADDLDDVFLSGSGSVRRDLIGNDPLTFKDVISMVALGDYNEFPEVDEGGGNNGGGNEGPGQGLIGTAVGEGFVVDGSLTTSTGRLALPAQSGGAASFVPVVNEVTNFGVFNLREDGSWSYVLDAIQGGALKGGEERMEQFIVFTEDGSSTVVSVRVFGAQSPATISGQFEGGIVEDQAATVTGQLNVVDLDRDEQFFEIVDAQGQYGRFTLSQNGAWTYTVNQSNPVIQSLRQGQTLIEQFDAVSLDGLARRAVVLTITGNNDMAVIAGVTETNANYAAGSRLTGSFTVTDVDQDEAAFKPQTTVNALGTFQLLADGAWTFTIGESAALNDLLLGESLSAAFVVESLDGTATQTLTIRINGVKVVQPEPEVPGNGTPGTPGNPGTPGTPVLSPVDVAALGNLLMTIGMGSAFSSGGVGSGGSGSAGTTSSRTSLSDTGVSVSVGGSASGSSQDTGGAGEGQLSDPTTIQRLDGSSNLGLGISSSAQSVTDLSDPAATLDKQDSGSESADVYEDMPSPSAGEAGQAVEGAAAEGADEQVSEAEAEASAEEEKSAKASKLDEVATGLAAASALIGSTSGRINWKRRK
ncbi:MAG TPA: VCBS domain-containing protein [Limnobacter sp.]|nr:VCBS domain-containing protein [Limnobacter sp.]